MLMRSASDDGHGSHMCLRLGVASLHAEAPTFADRGSAREAISCTTTAPLIAPVIAAGLTLFMDGHNVVELPVRVIGCCSHCIYLVSLWFVAT